jgi:site-specific recombinase XerC
MAGERTTDGAEKPRPRTRRVIVDPGGGGADPAATAILVERFLAYVRHERGLATNTQAAYRRDLRDFTGWLKGRAPGSLSVRDLGDYFAFLSGRGLARASVARQARSCSSRGSWRRARPT